MSDAETSLPGAPLRIAVLGDMDGAHTHRWLRVFVDRGHDVHAISYYPPTRPPAGVSLHILRGGAAAGEVASAGSLIRTGLGHALPPSIARPVQALRYLRAGLRSAVHSIRPDLFHGHFVVEHGFYGSFVGFHPYVVSAWGSDLYQAPRGLAGRWTARRALSRADLVTVNDPDLGARAAALGVEPERIAVVRLGIDDLFFEAEGRSANEGPPYADPPTIISDRALEPLYRIDVVLKAFARLRQRQPTARLIVANDGSERERLESLARALGLGESIRFVGRLAPEELRDTLARSHVYVSVPESDSFALSTMEAMAVGAFPVVSDLPSQAWIVHRVNGMRVPVGSVDALTHSLEVALTDDALRRAAVAPNRQRVWAEGRLLPNMLLMERHYYRLTGRPLADKGGL